jgi:hypothetical protein
VMGFEYSLKRTIFATVLVAYRAYSIRARAIFPS